MFYLSTRENLPWGEILVNLLRGKKVYLFSSAPPVKVTFPLAFKKLVGKMFKSVLWFLLRPFLGRIS